METSDKFYVMLWLSIDKRPYYLSIERSWASRTYCRVWPHQVKDLKKGIGWYPMTKKGEIDEKRIRIVGEGLSFWDARDLVVEIERTFDQGRLWAEESDRTTEYILPEEMRWIPPLGTLCGMSLTNRLRDMGEDPVWSDSVKARKMDDYLRNIEKKVAVARIDMAGEYSTKSKGKRVIPEEDSIPALAALMETLLALDEGRRKYLSPTAMAEILTRAGSKDKSIIHQDRLIIVRLAKACGISTRGVRSSKADILTLLKGRQKVFTYEDGRTLMASRTRVKTSARLRMRIAIVPKPMKKEEELTLEDLF